MRKKIAKQLGYTNVHELNNNQLKEIAQLAPFFNVKLQNTQAHNKFTEQLFRFFGKDSQGQYAQLNQEVKPVTETERRQLWRRVTIRYPKV